MKYRQNQRGFVFFNLVKNVVMFYPHKTILGTVCKEYTPLGFIFGDLVKPAFKPNLIVDCLL